MTAPRTLTEALRSCSADQLADLLRLRPDLGYPLPRHVADLVALATTATSIARAVDGLNAWQAAVAETLAVLPDGCSVEDLHDLLGAKTDELTTAVQELRRRALLWGADDDLHLVRSARDHFGSYPGGLAPPSPHPLTAEQIDTALAACGDVVRPVLDRLLWGPPTGTVRNADRMPTVEQARTPVEVLLAHRLLLPQSRDTVVLAREVALRLRSSQSDWLLGPTPVPTTEPVITGRQRPAAMIDSAAVGAANELVHDTELLIAELGATPRRLLRDGGLSARDVAALSRSVDDRIEYAGFVLEAAAAAGLIGSQDKITLLPTPEYDRWIGQPGPARWQRLAEAWRDAERYFSATAREHPLNADARVIRAPDDRRLVLGVLARSRTGTQVDPTEITAAVGWHRPSASRDPDRLAQIVHWTWQETGWLGLSALGAVSGLLPAIADGTRVGDELARLFPEPLDHVIIQSDLTAVAQGPLEAAVAGVLRLLAEQESRGGGAVYRFTAASVRRAFDSGWASTEIVEWLQRHSSTGVPQPLRYLVDDVARQHGTIRVGSATSYLRVEDPAHQASILAHPEAARLSLRAIAPGVLVSAADPDEVVLALRRLGLKPAAEDAEGRLLTSGPPRRAVIRPQSPDRPATADPQQAAAAILAAEQRLPPTGADDGIGLLAEAADSRQPVQVSFVGPEGSRSTRTFIPVRVGDGSALFADPDSDQQLSLPIARISEVRPVGPGRSKL